MALTKEIINTQMVEAWCNLVGICIKLQTATDCLGQEWVAYLLDKLQYGMHKTKKEEGKEAKCNNDIPVSTMWR